MFYRILMLAIFLSITGCESDDQAEDSNDRVLTPLISGVSPFSEISSQRFEILHSEEAYLRLFSRANPFQQPPTLMDLDFSRF